MIFVFGTCELDVDRVVLRRFRFFEFAQLFRPLGGDVLRRFHPLLFALGRRTGPIAQPADVAAVGEKEQGKDSQP